MCKYWTAKTCVNIEQQYYGLRFYWIVKDKLYLQYLFICSVFVS